MNITIGNTNITTLDNALQALIKHTEQTHGPLDTLNGKQLQQAITHLIKHGALSQRNAVNTIAKHAHISRVSIYNYINNHYNYQ